MSELSTDVASRLMFKLAVEVGFTSASMCEDERDEVNDNLHLFASGRCEDVFVKSRIAECWAVMWNRLLKNLVNDARCFIIPVWVFEVSAFRAPFFPVSIGQK